MADETQEMSVRSESENEQPAVASGTANKELAMTLSQVIASSVEKLGDPLAETLNQGYNELENYEEEEVVEETDRPPHKKSMTSGAFGVLQNLLVNAAAPQESDTAPSQTGAQPDVGIRNGENSISIINEKADVIGEAVLHLSNQDMNKEGVGDPVQEDTAVLIDKCICTPSRPISPN